ncbi:hypothetical protein SODALDRAFT_329487 [Sodiomyces alkalinus F11]|uniref:Basic proline-rich protein n=1 Tax=Sodiomyces alkalinus (strain CBS 110278 / VKM F-3762 / F11) TaxID=1314773 RepID=A0A3N2PJT8_SODAK|nr:hypothetical protein SODALDRAFT_329487 [Sodiomyces alkalinus F11]ROT34798.1 hypothetical protein SODALDRAFT_329487 [Sodiomyces alkalinus F11]
MEPVPEAERMEQFHPSPVPSLCLQNASASPSEFQLLKKPPTIRRSTDPSPSLPSFSWTPPTFPYRPRTTSPLSRTHTRSRSAVSLTHGMSRTQSMPGVTASGHILYSPQLRPASPCGSPSRARAPRNPVDEAFPTSPVRNSVLEKERKGPGQTMSPPQAFLASSTTTACYRRPSSPLRHATHAIVCPLSPIPTTPSSVPPYSCSRYHDALSNNYNNAILIPSSPLPSTPTSARSRSPSISSLETIPDSPDAEEAAMEAERIARLKAAAEEAETGEPAVDLRCGGSFDTPTRGRTLGFISRDKRKRWSVCGAERRGDIDLETIWED